MSSVIIILRRLTTFRHLSFEELYRTCYTMVIRGRADRVYEDVKELLSQHVTSLTSHLISLTLDDGSRDDEDYQSHNELTEAFGTTLVNAFACFEQVFTKTLVSLYKDHTMNALYRNVHLLGSRFPTVHSRGIAEIIDGEPLFFIFLNNIIYGLKSYMYN